MSTWGVIKHAIDAIYPTKLRILKLIKKKKNKKIKIANFFSKTRKFFREIEIFFSRKIETIAVSWQVSTTYVKSCDLIFINSLKHAIFALVRREVASRRLRYLRLLRALYPP